ncbi:unnamed protein product, partial [Aphanomyces euteiches]
TFLGLGLPAVVAFKAGHPSRAAVRTSSQEAFSATYDFPTRRLAANGNCIGCAKGGSRSGSRSGSRIDSMNAGFRQGPATDSERARWTTILIQPEKR